LFGFSSCIRIELGEPFISGDVGRAASQPCGPGGMDALVRQPQGNCRSYADIAAQGQIAAVQLD